MKLKGFCKASDNVHQSKQQPTKCKKIFTNFISDTGLISKIHELKKLDINIYNPITKWGTVIDRILNTEISNGWETQKCSTSLVIKEVQIKLQ